MQAALCTFAVIDPLRTSSDFPPKFFGCFFVIFELFLLLCFNFQVSHGVGVSPFARRVSFVRKYTAVRTAVVVRVLRVTCLRLHLSLLTIRYATRVCLPCLLCVLLIQSKYTSIIINSILESTHLVRTRYQVLRYTWSLIIRVLLLHGKMKL